MPKVFSSNYWDTIVRNSCDGTHEDLWRAHMKEVYEGLLGLFMGMPFPLSMNCFTKQDDFKVPWYLAINSFFSIDTTTLSPFDHDCRHASYYDPGRSYVCRLFFTYDA